MANLTQEKLEALFQVLKEDEAEKVVAAAKSLNEQNTAKKVRTKAVNLEEDALTELLEQAREEGAQELLDALQNDVEEVEEEFDESDKEFIEAIDSAELGEALKEYVLTEKAGNSQGAKKGWMARLRGGMGAAKNKVVAGIKRAGTSIKNNPGRALGAIGVAGLGALAAYSGSKIRGRGKPSTAVVPYKGGGKVVTSRRKAKEFTFKDDDEGALEQEFMNFVELVAMANEVLAAEPTAEDEAIEVLQEQKELKAAYEDLQSRLKELESETPPAVMQMLRASQNPGTITTKEGTVPGGPAQDGYNTFIDFLMTK